MKNIKNKKAFTLIEMAIVLIILSMVIGTVISMTRASYQKNRLNETKNNIHKIKQSIIGYAGIYNKLPSADTAADTIPNDGKGEGNTGIGNISYIDLQLNSKDEFGMVYQYDVNDDLLTATTNQQFCNKLSVISGSDTEFPLVENDDASQKYSVAAIVISKGENKLLTGKNDDSPAPNNREYEMSSNTYAVTTNDDLVIEITASELYSRLCEDTAGTYVRIDNNEIGADLNISYTVGSDESQCNLFYHNDTANATSFVSEMSIVADDINISFFHDDMSCTFPADRTYTFDQVDNNDTNNSQRVKYDVASGITNN